jgi:hypothetical protein
MATYSKDFDLAAAAERIREKRRRYEAACGRRREAAKVFARGLALDLGASGEGVRKGGDWSFLMGRIPSSNWIFRTKSLEIPYLKKVCSSMSNRDSITQGLDD